MPTRSAAAGPRLLQAAGEAEASPAWRLPQIAFFLAHLLFGLAAGIVLVIAFRRPGVARALRASR